VRHVPPAEAEVGATVELVASAPASTPTLVAHVRTTGHAEFRAIELVRRDDARWVAVVPAAQVELPGLDYYLDAGGQAVFATAAWPHTLAVHASSEVDRRTRDLARYMGRRSVIHTAGEWVEFGTRTVTTPTGPVSLIDRYYRIDADFAYRLWAYPLEDIRVGYTRLLGDTESTASRCAAGSPCTAQAGFKVAGWFELGLAPLEGVQLDGRVMVMATQTGFAIGARGEARLGDRDASHVALGAEYMADVGSAGYFRLGWGTVPRFPMAATVEVTNMPASNRDTGVRLYYDVAHALGNGLRLGVRAGYAARNQTVAGFTGGGTVSVEF